jgi:hypothetical protein
MLTISKLAEIPANGNPANFWAVFAVSAGRPPPAFIINKQQTKCLSHSAAQEAVLMSMAHGQIFHAQHVVARRDAATKLCHHVPSVLE